MNLMDMLSESAEDSTAPPELPDTELADLPAPANNVYYLPTVFTKLQKDMSEAVVQIFAPALSRKIIARNQRASINNLLESDKPVYNGDTENHDMVTEELSALMFDQLLRLLRHPSLVVDHFIPKKLLLLEVKERLLHMSGKLEFFDRLVDFVAKKYTTVVPGAKMDDYNMLVVGESVKELEWIEGLIVGKKVNYRNLSARKLYDDENRDSQFVKEDSVDDEHQNNDFKRRRRHFVARYTRKKVHRPCFTLHLVTSRQLYLSFSSSTVFDIVVSFDSELDINSASIELLRSNNRMTQILSKRVDKTPVIVPISLFSVEHIMLIRPRPTFGDEKAWKLQVTNTYIANRFQLFKGQDTDFYLNMYGCNFLALLEWLFGWDKASISGKVKPIQHYNDDVILSVSDEKLESRLADNYLQALGKIFADTTNGWDNTSMALFSDTQLMTYDAFKARLAEFLTSRREQAEMLIQEGNTNILPVFRDAEAQRQVEIDEHEDLIGEEYRKLRKLNEQANIVDRKFNRAESDYVRATDCESEITDILKHLEDVVSTKSDANVAEMLKSQNVLVMELEEERARLTHEYAKVTDDADCLRVEYQTKSAEAVLAISALDSAKALQTLLEAKLNRPGMTTLPTLTRKDEKMIYEDKLRRLRLENRFISQMFLRRLDQLVKERNAILDSTLTGLTSRPSNRISRASTPFT